MATERNPFDPIKMGELSIEIESSTGVDEDGNEAFMEVDPEDGGIVVDQQYSRRKNQKSSIVILQKIWMKSF
jgi:hypothetical protein